VVEPSVSWFICFAALAILGFCAGHVFGRHSTGRCVAGLIVGFGIMLAWTFLSRHPAVAVHVVPVRILTYLEGIAGVPVFTFVIGIVHARSALRRQRRLSHLALCVGALSFLNGGLWMLQTTPRVGFAETVDDPLVRQSHEFSCVPAACATALNLSGIEATEAEMARLTRVRPGTGATLVRALDGLERKLAGTGLKPELIDVSVDELDTLPLPALTPIAVSPTQYHMVVIMGVGETGIKVADPQNGRMWIAFSSLGRIYTGHVIVFQSRH